jgi:haloacetate dehalogenase
MLDGFEALEVDTGETVIFARRAGTGPPVLLLHGFPQTHLMWRGVGPLLSRDFSVVCADLRGYGRSGCPSSTPEQAAYAKRAMARDMVAVMEHLGFRRFSLAGHDRGGRVAYRIALDHPEHVARLAVLDIVPTGMAWDRADARFAVAYWPWSFLAQPVPLPERVLAAVPDVVVDAALGGWGTPREVFPAEVRAAYIDVLRDPEHAHAICEEYRAAAGVDREHDRADRLSRRRIAAPVLVLWSALGPVGTWYAGEGGALELWRSCADEVSGHALDAGHFFPEEVPGVTAEALSQFFAS